MLDPDVSIYLVASGIRAEERGLIEAFGRRRTPAQYVDDRYLVVDLGKQHFPLPAVVLNRSVSATRRHYVGRLFESQGCRVLNSASVVETCDDKVLTALALAPFGVPTPRTQVAIGCGAGPSAVNAVGFPAVVKSPTGSWGRMVSRVNDKDAAEAVFEYRAHLGPQHGVALVQDLIDKPGRDIRVVVLGGAVLGALYRESEHWRTNTSRGAATSVCPLDDELVKIAVAAADAVGGGFVGVDLMESPSGELLVSEVNATVQLGGFVEQHGTAVYDQVVDYVLGVA